MLHKVRGKFDVLRLDTWEVVSFLNSLILTVLHWSHYNHTRMNYFEETKVDGKKTYWLFGMFVGFCNIIEETVEFIECRYFWINMEVLAQKTSEGPLIVCMADSSHWCGRGWLLGFEFKGIQSEDQCTRAERYFSALAYSTSLNILE